MAAGNQNRLSHFRIMDEREHKVIMQVSNVEDGQQRMIVGQINNLLNSLPGATVAVVFHGQGLALVLAGEDEAVSAVDALLKRGVKLSACENTMEARGITKEALLPGIGTVRSAVAELVLKQEAGWIYVRIGG